MILLPHNKKAADAVMANFETSNRSAVVHCCGSGKSFLGGAVAANFHNVLIVAPNDHVLNQASKAAPNAECRTYAWISMQDEMPKGYDLIWFDEFHRMGAETWSIGCQRLIEANPNAKILGTTATSERSLERRDMAEEWFHNDVVSTLTNTDAWIQGIHRVPVYVIGVISMDDTRADYKAKIYNAKRIDKKHKQQANVLLDNVLLDWNNSYGVSRIIEKYIDKDVERVVVFAQSIQKLNETKETLPKWFADAGIKVAGVYSAHSKMGSSEAMRQVKAFEDDNREGVKILISVDMLNEGVHVDRVDAVILFRATISKNIYMQQIGRCFAVGQKHQPIILDLADNLTKACGYDGIYEAKNKFDKAKRQFANPLNKEKGGDKFLIIDTLKETREVLSQIDRITADSRSWDDIAEFVKNFHAEHGKLPGRKDDESIYAYLNMHRRQYYIYKYPERIAFLESLGWQREVEQNLTFEEAYNIVKDYKEKHGTLPTTTFKALRSLKGRMNHGKCTEEQMALLKELGIKHTSTMQHWMDRYNEIKAVYDATGSLEACNKDQRGWIYPQQESKKLNKEQRELLNAIGAFDLKKVKGYRKGDYYILRVVDWVKEHGYLPSITDDRALYSTWRGAYRNQGEYWERFKSYGIDETFIREKETYMDKLAVFYEENGRLPEKGEKLYEGLRQSVMQKENREYAIKHWGFKNENEKKFEKKFAEFKAYVIERGYLPRLHSHDEGELVWSRFITNNTKDTSRHKKEVEDFIKDYNYREAFKKTQLKESDFEDWKRLKEYVTTNNRLPAKNDPLFGLIARFAHTHTLADEYAELFMPFGYGENTFWTANAIKAQNIQDFYREYGHLPSAKEDKALYDTLQLSKRWKKKGIYKLWTDLFEKMGFNYEKNQIRQKLDDWRQRIIDFLIENRRLPIEKEDGVQIRQSFSNYKRLHREDYDKLLKEYLY